MLTRKQIAMMCHALGWRADATSWPLDNYRNGYSVSPLNTDDMELWRDMVGQKLAMMVGRPSLMSPNYYFQVTETGKDWLLMHLANTPYTERRQIECEH